MITGRDPYVGSMVDSAIGDNRNPVDLVPQILILEPMVIGSAR